MALTAPYECPCCASTSDLVDFDSTGDAWVRACRCGYVLNKQEAEEAIAIAELRNREEWEAAKDREENWKRERHNERRCA